MWPTRTLHQLQTGANADSVEFLPSEFGTPPSELRTFVCGNYQLNEATRQKFGSIYLYQLMKDETVDSDTISPPSSSFEVESSGSSTCVPLAPAYASQQFPLRQHQHLETDAIFDLKWCPKRVMDGKMILGQADASGKLVLYEYRRDSDAEDAAASLTPFASQQVVEGASCLSLDWNNRIHATPSPTIAVSQSNSRISLFELTTRGDLELQTSWIGHEYEMWIVSFNSHTPHLLYSGADDCKFRGWDIRQTNTLRTSIFTDTTHEMGVCSIQNHPTREHILATGSYDEAMRIWDTRQMKEPIITHAMGGGAWRVRWNPSNDTKRKDTILCCAMNNGFAVVDVDFDKVDPSEAASSSSSSTDSSPISSGRATTVVSYKAHASLAYGADWCAAPIDIDTNGTQQEAELIATCSFYDKQLNVWTVQRPQTTTEAE